MPASEVISRSDLHRAGLNNHGVRKAMRSKELTELLPGVYLRGGGTPTWPQQVAAALKWAGPESAAALQTAANLYGLGDFDRTSVHIAVPGSPKLPPSAGFDLVLLRERDHDTWDVRTVDGLRVTAVERTLFDLAGALDPRTHELLVAEAIKKKKTNALRLRACFKRLRTRGRRGIAAMEALFARRGYSLRRLESELERQLLTLMHAQGLPEPTQQYDWPPEGKPDYRLDFAYVDLKLAIEADAYITHSSEKDWSQDQTRMNALVAAGWSFLRFTQRDLAHPKETAELIRRAMRARGWRPPPQR